MPYLDDLNNTVLLAEDRRNGYSIVAYYLVCRGLYDLMRACRQSPVHAVANRFGVDRS